MIKSIHNCLKGPWAYKVYKLYKMDKPELTLNKREWIGLLIGTMGAIIRNFSKAWIGTSFAYFLSIRKDQKLITNGPYSICRHPGYAGMAMWLWGDAIFWNNPFAYLWALFYTRTLHYRMNEEEEILQNEFQNEWDEYCNKTKARILPFVY